MTPHYKELAIEENQYEAIAIIKSTNIGIISHKGESA